MSSVSFRLNKYWAAPLLGGGAVLLLSFGLIPRPAELQQALSRKPQAAAPQAVAVAPTPASIPSPSPVELQTVLQSADAAGIAQAVGTLRSSSVAVTTAQIVHDLSQLGRFKVALEYLDQSADDNATGLWRTRFELLRKLGQTDAARSLVVKAVGQNGGVPQQDIVEAAYALDAPELVLVAAENRAIAALDPARTLDLVRRFETKKRLDLIARLDALGGTDWRASDPWLAIRLARGAGDTDKALRYAQLLPWAEREAMRETILREQGNKAALRTMLLDRAARPNAKPASIAEELLAAGLRDDAMQVLARAATGTSPRHPNSQRLLYLMGPRPGAREVKWLQARTVEGSAANQREWIEAYVQRDKPQSALAFINRHPQANTPDVLMTRLSLARAAGDDATGIQLMNAVLDQPQLNADQIRALAALAPPNLPPALSRKWTEKRLQTGLGGAREILDLASQALTKGDAKSAAQRLTSYLIDHPKDMAALRLMAEAQQKLNGDAAARPWRERALAEARPGTRDQAELLESLRRFPEALAVVDDLIGTRPADKTLIAYKARLLLANGQPGRARKVLQP